MFNAATTPNPKAKSSRRLFSRLFARGTSEVPALAGGVSVEVTQSAADADAEFCALYIAAGIRPPTPLLKSCGARFEGPSPKFAREVPAPYSKLNRNKATYNAPKGVGLGLRNVKVCPVQPIGWKVWPEESDSLSRSTSASSDESDDERLLGSDDVFAPREGDSYCDLEEEEWSLDNVSPENIENAIWACKMAMRKRVIAGMRARATGWN
ncbi:unnamed protein product [Peniophora sp. CBMAI 1063]|nr:unnamed protein product [Peniophora sp. CBMAI 1063]